MGRRIAANLMVNPSITIVENPELPRTNAPDYVLGHSETELQRLILQANFYERQTESLLLSGGLTAGQRVIDFGCGAGDVSFLAARLVGPTGSVLGVDRSPAAIQTARGRAARSGLRNVEFIQADDETLGAQLPAGSFDALVGRLVLLYQRDPLACLRRLAPLLRPNGAAIFHEIQMSPGWYGAFPGSPLVEQLRALMSATCERAGIEQDMGMKLGGLLQAAGFVAPESLLTARVESGPDSPVYAYFAETMRSLLPAMIKLGLTTEAEIDVDTLADRLREEITASNGSVVVSMLIGCHARWPAR